MKLSNLSWRYRRTLEYLKPTSYTPSVPFLFLFITNKISSASILSTTRHYPHYRFQGIRPQPLHSFIGSPLALGDRRQLPSTVASPHIEEWEATVDLPYPAVKCVITQVTHASPDQHCWAVLILGAFYDANDRILWQTEIFLGDKAEDSEETYGDSYSVSDAEEDQTLPNILDTYTNQHENDFDDAHSETASDDSDFDYFRQRARILARVNESAAQQDYLTHIPSFPTPGGLQRLWDPIRQTWVDVYPQGNY